MLDSEVVASIVAGDPNGLAEAYDRYANALFGYCRSLLREPADAADAVQDTFVIAASRLSGLRDPDLLRPWLFAVARNECLRRLKSREAASALDESAEQADESVDVGGEAERAQTRALLRAAVDGSIPPNATSSSRCCTASMSPRSPSCSGCRATTPTRSSPERATSSRRRSRRCSSAAPAVRTAPRLTAAAGLGRAADGPRCASGSGGISTGARRLLGPAAPRAEPALLLALSPGALLGLAASDGLGPLAPGAAATGGPCTSPPTQVAAPPPTARGRGRARDRSISMVFRGHRRAGTSALADGAPAAQRGRGDGRGGRRDRGGAGGRAARRPHGDARDRAGRPRWSPPRHGAARPGARRRAPGPRGAARPPGRPSASGSPGPRRRGAGPGRRRPQRPRRPARARRPARRPGRATRQRPSPTTSDPTATPSPTVSVRAAAPLTGAIDLSTTTVELTLLGHGTLTLTAAAGRSPGPSPSRPRCLAR